MRSDVERRRLAGIEAGERSGSGLGTGLYSEEMDGRVYDRLAQCASDVVAGRLTAIVDATFQRRIDRDKFAELAANAGVRARLIHCRAPRAVLEQRITERLRRDDDASEADLAVMRWQSARFDPIEPGEAFTLVEVSTTEPDLPKRLALELKP